MPSGCFFPCSHLVRKHKSRPTLCGIDNPNGTKLKLFINGRFLSQKLTGVQRYAAELVKAIDALLASDQLPAALKGAEWQLLVPNETSEAKRFFDQTICARMSKPQAMRLSATVVAWIAACQT